MIYNFQYQLSVNPGVNCARIISIASNSSMTSEVYSQYEIVFIVTHPLPAPSTDGFVVEI